MRSPEQDKERIKHIIEDLIPLKEKLICDETRHAMSPQIDDTMLPQSKK